MMSQQAPKPGLLQSQPSQPLPIGNVKKEKTKTKTQMLARSAPNPYRPSPPKPPIPRPRVPSFEPPPFSLPPSPVTSDPVPVVAEGPKRKKVLGRSLTNASHVPKISSSAPNVSFVPFQRDFRPSFASVGEDSKEEGKEGREEKKDDEEKIKEEVGSPTIIMMLQLEGDERRRTMSVASPPTLTGVLGAAAGADAGAGAGAEAGVGGVGAGGGDGFGQGRARSGDLSEGTEEDDFFSMRVKDTKTNPLTATSRADGKTNKKEDDEPSLQFGFDDEAEGDETDRSTNVTKRAGIGTPVDDHSGKTSQKSDDLTFSRRAFA